MPTSDPDIERPAAKDIARPSPLHGKEAGATLILALDCSSSLKGVPFEKQKIAAKNLINILYSQSRPRKGNLLGRHIRAGVVGFSETARKIEPLTRSVPDLKAAVDRLQISPGTNHCDGFLKAAGLLGRSKALKKALVMFTDGHTSAGGDPSLLTEGLKEGGMRIYIVGLEGIRGKNAKVIRSWANYPPAAHTDLTDDLEQIDALFEKIAGFLT